MFRASLLALTFAAATLVAPHSSAQAQGKMMTTADGLKYIDVKVGTGPEAKGKTATETTYKAVNVTLRPRFIVTPGPALSGFKMKVDYFVAMPQFYPSPEGRAEFSRTVETSPARTQVDVTDADVEIRIPLNEKRRGDGVTIFLGFTLTDEQLKENRSRSSGRLFR